MELDKPSYTIFSVKKGLSLKTVIEILKYFTKIAIDFIKKKLGRLVQRYLPIHSQGKPWINLEVVFVIQRNHVIYKNGKSCSFSYSF